jgi:hypothetical protein
VAHIYNPSYSGGRDQEDRGLRPAQALKIPNTKGAGRVVHVVERLLSKCDLSSGRQSLTNSSSRKVGKG